MVEAACSQYRDEDVTQRDTKSMVVSICGMRSRDCNHGESLAGLTAVLDVSHRPC